ncbi:MAG: thioredoxin [Zoogloeaceae bacterium]|jgi:thioredoxin 1|nr:thioredoxin [Zoogloeaceae bacterium]
MTEATISILSITVENFEAEVLNSELPVLVDYWAPWCQPCQMMMPAFEAVAVDYAGKIKFGKLNIDTESEIAARYNVRGVPTLMLFKGGSPEDARTGAQSKSQLIAMIDNAL